MVRRRRQADAIQAAVDHGRELAGTVIGRVSDLTHDHSSVEYRTAVMVAFSSAGIVCGSSHPDQAEAEAFMIAFTVSLRAATKDPALHLEDE